MKELQQEKKKKKFCSWNAEMEMQLHNSWAPTSWQASQDARSQETHSNVPESQFINSSFCQEAADNIGLHKSKTKKVKILVIKQKYW